MTSDEMTAKICPTLACKNRTTIFLKVIISHSEWVYLCQFLVNICVIVFNPLLHEYSY